MDALSYRHSRSALGRVAAGVIAASLALLAALPASAQTIDRIKQSGKMTLGYSVQARPFSYNDAAGNPIGYTIELCQKIVDAARADLGVQQLAVTFVPVTLANALSAVQQGQVDLLCDPHIATVASRKQVSYSISVFPSGVGVLVHRNASARLTEVLSGREPPRRPQWRASAYQTLQQSTLAVVSGSPTERLVNERMKELQLNAKVVPVIDFVNGVAQVADRRVDAFFGDKALLLDTAKRSKAAADLLVLDRYFSYQAGALALARDDNDFRLLVDRALSHLFFSGEWGDIYSKWFGPPNEGTLNFFQLNVLRE